MISVGIDVSKGHSCVCIMKDGAVIQQFVLQHSKQDVDQFLALLLSFEELPRVVLEATGIHHLPLAHSLSLAGIFVAVLNPLLVKKYSPSISLRKVKTDKADAVKIADYGLSKWHLLRPYSVNQDAYHQLKGLGRNYLHYTKLKVMQKQHLNTLLDLVMPGIESLIRCAAPITPTKDKLLDFVEQYRHFDRITSMSEQQFITHYCQWAKKKGYQPSERKASLIHALAKASIPTLCSKNSSTTMSVLEAVKVLRHLGRTLQLIVAQMLALAQQLPEFSVVRAMPGVGDILAVRLIAEIGDIDRFYSSKALVAFAGVDSTHYESGNFVAESRKISKRGSPLLRKTCFEIMKALMANKPQQDGAVYLFMAKKVAEGKAKKAAMIAGITKFLRIYYARVKEVRAAPS